MINQPQLSGKPSQAPIRPDVAPPYETDSRSKVRPELRMRLSARRPPAPPATPATPVHIPPQAEASSPLKQYVRSIPTAAAPVPSATQPAATLTVAASTPTLTPATAARPPNTTVYGNRFGLSDFVEDCEGFNLAHAFTNSPSTGIPGLVRQVLSTGTPRDNCFLRFLRGRVYDSSATAEALGQNAVSGPVDSVYDGLRIALLYALAPHVTLGQFDQGEREAVGRLFGERWVEMARA